MKAKANQFQYIVLRPQPDGSIRPRFQPAGGVRKLGFASRDLKHPNGRWFTRDECAAESRRLAALIAGARVDANGAQAIAEQQRNARSARTVETFLRDWATSELPAAVAAGRLKASSKASYEKAIDAIIWQPETREQAAERAALAHAAAVCKVPGPVRPLEHFATLPIVAISKPILREFYEYAVRYRGHHMARYMISAFSAAWSWGAESSRWNLPGINPRYGMKFNNADGRVRWITPEEFAAFIAAADAIGRPSIGDSWYLGYFHGRRQSDRLTVSEDHLRNGYIEQVQSKTGKLITLPLPDELAIRLEQARARVAAIRRRMGTLPGTIVVDEATGLPYLPDTYRHWVGVVRQTAVEGIEGKLDPCPSLASARDQDLRDTCVRELFLAGVDALDICAVTGHSYQSIDMIRKHYLGVNSREGAARAMDKLAARRRQQPPPPAPQEDRSGRARAVVVALRGGGQ